MSSRGKFQLIMSLPLNTRDNMEGIIATIHGDVIEIEFNGVLPNINDSLVVKKMDGTNILLEVHDHISSTLVKAIALGFTQSLKRGMSVISSGSSLKIPVSKNCLGRVFNVFAEPTDGKPSIEDYKSIPIHKSPPVLE